MSIVGGGGKTSLLFALASEAVAAGLSTLALTTTRMSDPRDEGRAYDAFLLDADWAPPAGAGAAIPGPGCLLRAPGESASGFLAIATSVTSGGKMGAIDPGLVDAATGWDLIVVEADGARRLPIKAPAGHEPVIPSSSDVVIAVIGLDCLGKPLDDSVAFRPELVARAAGMSPGDVLRPRHLAALAASADGCFKSTPRGALRVLALNKADLVDGGAAEETADAALRLGVADVVVLSRFADARPERRLVSVRR